MVSFHSVLRVRRMNYELDRNQLQSIALGLFAFDNSDTIDSNEEYLAIGMGDVDLAILIVLVGDKEQFINVKHRQ